MALLTHAELRAGGPFAYVRGFIRQELREMREEAQGIHKPYDIFLSHSIADKDEIATLAEMLEAQEIARVYVDWRDPRLDRENVTPETAETLCSRMDACRSLLFAFSLNAAKSAWMPWELGYFHGRKGRDRAAVIPITEGNAEFERREYLGLYPFIGRDHGTFYVNASALEKLTLADWLASGGDVAT